MNAPAVRPFPPRPRAWSGLVDDVLTRASTTRCIAWQPVHASGLDHAWVGVASPSLGSMRQWQWDVVTPEDHYDEPLLRNDPLTIAVDQDLVVVDVCRDDTPRPVLHLQIPVRLAPTSIDVSASAMPPPPWRVELATGWSTEAIARGVGFWLAANLGRPVPMDPPAEPQRTDSSDRSDDERIFVGDDVWSTGEAFDELLSLDATDAAHVMRAFSAISDALAPYR